MFSTFFCSDTVWQISQFFSYFMHDILSLFLSDLYLKAYAVLFSVYLFIYTLKEW